MWGDRNRRRKPAAKPVQPEPEEEMDAFEPPEDDLEEDNDEQEPYWLSRWCDVFELALGQLMEANSDKLVKGDTELVDRAREIANASILQMQFKYAEFEQQEADEREAKEAAEEKGDDDKEERIERRT